jgi:hypothetical protein
MVHNQLPHYTCTLAQLKYAQGCGKQLILLVALGMLLIACAEWLNTCGHAGPAISK